MSYLVGGAGMKLTLLRRRSGLSLGAIAAKAGFAGPSSMQRYFAEDYPAKYIPIKLANALRGALVGAGSPPITDQDIDELIEPVGKVEPTRKLADVSTMELWEELVTRDGAYARVLADILNRRGREAREMLRVLFNHERMG